MARNEIQRKVILCLSSEVYNYIYGIGRDEIQNLLEILH